MNIPLSPYVPGNLVSRDGFSRPVPRQPAHSPYSGYLVLTYGIPPEFRGGIQHHTPSGQSRVYLVTQMCTDGVHCRQESTVYKRISTCLLYRSAAASSIIHRRVSPEFIWSRKCVPMAFTAAKSPPFINVLVPACCTNKQSQISGV